MPYVVDFGDVEERKFVILPRGRYAVEIETAEVKEGNKAPYLAVTLRLLEDEYNNQKLWTNLSFSPNALWKLMEFYRALGASDEDLQSSEFEVVEDDLIGAELEVSVVTGKDQNGEPRNEVKNYYPILEEPTEEIPF